MMDYKSFRNVIKTWIHCRSPWSQLIQTRTGLMGLRGDVSKGDVVSILLRVRDILQRASWTKLMKYLVDWWPLLGGGFKHFLFLPIFGEMTSLFSTVCNTSYYRYIAWKGGHHITFHWVLHEFRQKKHPPGSEFQPWTMPFSIWRSSMCSFQIPSFRKMTIFQATKRRTRKPKSFRPLGNPLHLALVPWYLPVDLPQVERVENRLRKQMANSQVNWAPRNLSSAAPAFWGFQTLRWRLRREKKHSSGWIPQPQKYEGDLYFLEKVDKTN